MRKSKTPAASLFIFSIETRNFSFEGVGVDKGEAEIACMDAVKKHCAEYTFPLKEFLEHYSRDSWELREIKPGHGYRNNQQIHPRKEP